MKQTLSFRATPEMSSRLEELAKATRLKKNTIIEMCIEIHLPVLEAKHADELIKQKKAARDVARGVGKETERGKYPAHREQHSLVEDDKNSRKKP